MGQTVTIDPVTRIEGHAKITVHLDHAGRVEAARFHVVEFRGFEKFCEGRYFAEMPNITSRVCGICPVSHLLAGAKACDAITGARIPRPAHLLRELMHMGQVCQSHALSFFHLSSPDLLLGWDSDPAERNVMGLIARHPQTARRGIRLRAYGQTVIETVAGRRIHAQFNVPGGVNAAMTTEKRDQLLAAWQEAVDNARFGLDLFKGYAADHAAEVDGFANFASGYMGLVTAAGGLEHYDGRLRIRGADGRPIAPDIDPADYLSVISEAVEPWSYLKFPFITELGYPRGIYRVGPLARLNLVDGVGTPLAQREWEQWRAAPGGLRTSSFDYHYARLIEILFTLERMRAILEDPDLLAPRVDAPGRVVNEQGVGCIEAPRGTLFHHYWVDRQGRIEKVNLVVATGHNNLAMNRAVTDIARQYVDGADIREGMLNRVEAAIRCYDPCLSCSTHAVGRMPLAVVLVGPDGRILRELRRDG